MKAWMAGAILFTLACIAGVASSPVFTGTWIVKNKTVGMVQAIVVTVGLAEMGPVVRIREVTAREDQQLYGAMGRLAPWRQARRALTGARVDLHPPSL